MVISTDRTLHIGLPKLSMENCTIENAKIDKCVINFERAIDVWFEESNEFLGFKDKLVDGEFVTEYEDHHMAIAQRSAWLLSSEKIYLPNLSGQSNRFVRPLRLNLNPTRYYQHNRYPCEYLQNVRDGNQQALLKDAHSSEKLKQYSYDGKDNYMSGVAYKHAQNFTDYFVSYLDRCLAYTFNHFNSAIETSGANVTFLPCLDNWAINEIEIYWDFYKKDALSYTSSLRDIIPTIYCNIRQGHFYRSRNRRMWSEYTEKDAVGYEMQIKKDVYLRVYAKCRNRVRMEVYFESSLYSLLPRTNRPPGRRYEAIPDVVGFAIWYAREKVLEFIRYTEHRPCITSFASDYAIFWKALLQACNGSVFMAAEVFNLLRTRKSLSKRGNEIDTAIDVLKSSGVLEQVRSQNRYRLTRRYIGVVQCHFVP